MNRLLDNWTAVQLHEVGGEIPETRENNRNKSTKPSWFDCFLKTIDTATNLIFKLI